MIVGQMAAAQMSIVADCGDQILFGEISVSLMSVGQMLFDEMTRSGLEKENKSATFGGDATFVPMTLFGAAVTLASIVGGTFNLAVGIKSRQGILTEWEGSVPMTPLY